MKTVVDMTGSGIGPRGSAEVKIKREFPDLVGADIFRVDSPYRKEVRNRETRFVTSFNIANVMGTEVPMLIGFINPKYSDAECPVKVYPKAEDVMNEFNEVYSIAEKWLKKSLLGVKLTNKFRICKWYSSINVAWDSIRKEWHLNMTGGFRNLPENNGLTFSTNINNAESYVEKYYKDEEIDNITDDEVVAVFDELHFLIRNNKYIMDAIDNLRLKLRTFENEYVTRKGIFSDIHTEPGFRGTIRIHSFDNIEPSMDYEFNTAKEAYDIVDAITVDDIIDYAKKNNLLMAPRPVEQPKTKNQELAEKKKWIAKTKKKTEVAFDDFLTDLTNLAGKQ